MPISDAKLAANRKNALLSTGPKTPEGKDRCRRNALKHGLTGSGVALPTEEQAEITERFIDLQMEMLPRTNQGSLLVRRFAFLSVRLERCERHETKESAKRVRHAIAKFDDERLAAVETLGAGLYRESATVSRRLQMTPEGIDWLLDEWEDLRNELTNPDPNRWTHSHRQHFDALLGRDPAGYKVARIKALSDAMAGYFHYLDKPDGEGLDDAERAVWAKGELIRLLDVEMARLKAVRIDLDPSAIAEDRAEAVDRAIFDDSPATMRARKYEAATERAMYKALKEFRQVEADALEGKETFASRCEIEDSDPVALNSQEPDDDETDSEPEDSTDPQSVKFEPSSATVLNISIGREPEISPKPTERIDVG